MIITTFTWLKSERFWRFAIGFLFFLGFLGGVYMGSLLIFPQASGTFGVEKENPAAAKAQTAKAKYDAIGEGALSLRESGASRFLPLIINELQLLGANTRPGHGDHSKLHLMLKSTGEERIAEPGKPFFLQLEEPKEGRLKIVGFSSNESGLKLTPISVRERGVRIEVGFVSEKGEEERGEVALEEKDTPLNNAPYCKQLKEARWWGVDALIRHYGGEEYREKKGRQKVEFGSSEGDICFVTTGDYLIWDEGLWKEADKSALSEKKPLAEVTAVSGHTMEMTVWDETGFLSEKVKLTPQFISKRPLNLDCLPTSIRMRSESEISCVLSKRRLLLKEGDWVLRIAHGWRILKRAKDVEDYLNHRLCGELFIFDKLEKEHGKVVLQGNYFDAMRTQMQKVTIPVSTEKRTPKAKRKTSSAKKR